MNNNKIGDNGAIAIGNNLNGLKSLKTLCDIKEYVSIIDITKECRKCEKYTRNAINFLEKYGYAHSKEPNIQGTTREVKKGTSKLKRYTIITDKGKESLQNMEGIFNEAYTYAQKSKETLVCRD